MAAARTLDVAYRQVLVNYPADAHGYTWHHRLLVIQGKDGKWVGVTPTHSVQVLDLSVEVIPPLRRASSFPLDLAPYIFGFDPLVGNEEVDLVAECEDLAAVMGIGPQAAVVAAAGSWYVADPAVVGFAEKVPEAAILDRDAVVTRDNVGLAKVADQWVYIEKVADAAVAGWLLKKRTGPGRDPRIACDLRDARGSRLTSESLAMENWSPVEKPDLKGPLPGPPVVPEYFEALRVSGKTIIQYDSDWRMKSGIPDRGLVARFHYALSEALRYLVTMDQLDPNHLLSAEYLTRWLIMIEMATQKNPKQPDWDGLEVMVSGRLKDSGAVEVPGFASWLTGVQRDQAQIMKQGRMLREERASERKKQNEKGEK